MRLSHVAVAVKIPHSSICRTLCELKVGVVWRGVKTTVTSTKHCTYIVATSEEGPSLLRFVG